MNSLLEPARDISEERMRLLLARKHDARNAYTAHLASRDTVWRELPSGYESKRAVLWFDLVEASNAVTEAGA